MRRPAGVALNRQPEPGKPSDLPGRAGRSRVCSSLWGARGVAAAGNDGPCADCVLFPANQRDVLAVGCTTQDETRCDFSAQGPEVALLAPGDRVLTLGYPGRSTYAVQNGTSFSVSFVAAAAAEAWNASPLLPANAVASRLEATAQNLTGAHATFGEGTGEVDFTCALANNKTCTFGPPPAVENVSAKPWGQALGIHVSWTSPSVVGGGARVQEFRIYRQDPTGTPSLRGIVPGGMRGFNDTAQNPTLLYAYWIVASDSGGDGPQSARACSLTSPAPAVSAYPCLSEPTVSSCKRAPVTASPLALARTTSVA